MDTKHNTDWNGRVEIYGIASPHMVEGSIESMFSQIAIYLRGAAAKKGPNGRRITIDFSTEELTDSKATDDERKMEAMNQQFAKWARPATDEEQARIDEMQGEAWRQEEGWKRLTILHSTQSSFESSPEEYNRLWNHYETEYPQSLVGTKKKSR